MVKKKNYNPFKMWGSYVGAIISFGIFQINDLISIFVNGAELLTLDTGKTIGICAIDAFPECIIYSNIWQLIGLGFLIGWGIHSLFRRFSK